MDAVLYQSVELTVSSEDRSSLMDGWTWSLAWTRADELCTSKLYPTDTRADQWTRLRHTPRRSVHERVSGTNRCIFLDMHHLGLDPTGDINTRRVTISIVVTRARPRNRTCASGGR